MSIYDLLLDSIWIYSQPTTLRRVMTSLGAAVEECGVAIDKANESGNREYLDSVIDEECGVVENLIGAAFVTCQAEITAVVSHVMQIHALAKDDGYLLTSSDGTKPCIMAIGGSTVGHSAYTEIQIINAVANYFKHNDEWKTPWDRLPKREKVTVDALKAVGCEESSTGNLRKGAEVLGVKDSELYLLATHVQKWSSIVHKTYQEELKRLKLV